MTEEKIKLGIIFGGRSGEHDVSLMSARSILSVLDSEKYEIFQIGISRQGKWLTGENVLDAFATNNIGNLLPAVLFPQPGSHTLFTVSVGELIRITNLDVIFPVLHGTFGEDGTLQGFLELADIAYVGAGVLGSAVGMDKGLFKYVMQANNIPVLEFNILNRSDIQKDIQEAIKIAESTAPYPIFVKPANLGSSVGISKCKNRAELKSGLEKACRYDRRIIVEKGINAREIEISVLGNDHPQASIPGEILPKDSFYTYEDKYINGKAETIIPEIDPELSRKLKELSIKAYKAVDCSGMARVDFLLDKETGAYYLGEINTIPGFTQISMYPKLWNASGLSYPELIDQLINLAIERKMERDQTEREYSS